MYILKGGKREGGAMEGHFYNLAPTSFYVTLGFLGKKLHFLKM
jgi:hypothetical protein